MSLNASMSSCAETVGSNIEEDDECSYHPVSKLQVSSE